jgi:hypothetical protein
MVLRTVTDNPNLVHPKEKKFEIMKKMLIIVSGGMRNYYLVTNGFAVK